MRSLFNCATAAPGVVAAGDVARWHHPVYGESIRLEHWTNAVEMGEAAARRLLRSFVDTMPRLNLGTLDSFLADIVRSFSHEFGLGGDFELPGSAERTRAAVPLSTTLPVICSFYVDELRREAGGI